jgi:hypothetical protein
MHMSREKDIQMQSTLHTVRAVNFSVLIPIYTVIRAVELYSYLRSPYKDLFVYDSVVQVRLYLLLEC